MWDTVYATADDYDVIDTGGLGPCIGMIIHNTRQKAAVVSHQAAGWDFSEAITLARRAMPPIGDHLVYLAGGLVSSDDDGDVGETVKIARVEVVESLIKAGYLDGQIKIHFNYDYEYASMEVNLLDGRVTLNSWP